jgi:hypothetical protein
LSTVLFFVYGIVAAVVIWQLAVWIGEIRYKNRQSNAAVEYSRRQQKPLLVAGGPWGGRPLRRHLKMPAHVMGDVSIDISSGAVEGHPNGIVATVTKLPFPDKTFGAALASHLLEHLYDTTEAKQALAEMSRVADSVFIAYPTRQSLAAWIIPDHRLWVWQKGDTVYLKQRRGERQQSSMEYYKLIDGKKS